MNATTTQGNQPQGDNAMGHTTKHNVDCKRVFNRYDLECPRCKELAAGQPARAGWGDARRQREAQLLRAIREHDFAECARVNFICTHFEH